jgi:RHS repeat-associated protein
MNLRTCREAAFVFALFIAVVILLTTNPFSYSQTSDGTPTSTPIIDPAKNQGDGCPNACGNPINFATGNKYEVETDYAAFGAFPLALTRYYGSMSTGGNHNFGQQWRSSYSRSITKTSATVALVTRDDGKGFTFALGSGAWTSTSDVNFRLTATADGWSLLTDQDEIETYDSNGALLSYANRAGLTQRFTRDAQGRLMTVADPFGRTMSFSYLSGSSSLIAQVTVPDGGVYAYAYDGGNRLVAVTFPDGSKRQYLYENTAFPLALTGLVDESGNRYATFSYDSSGRAISTQHAGGADLTMVDYLSQSAVSVTAPLGGVTRYLTEGVQGLAKQAQVSRSCSNCFSVGGVINNTYDRNGNSASTTDYLGHVTIFTHDLTRNLETSRTLAVGTPIARTISTTWSSTYRLPTQVVDGTRSVTNSYDSSGNLLSSTLNAPSGTSVRQFTYNNQGQVLTAADPRGNVTEYGYDALGNLASITNALRQATHYDYDANGRPILIQDPNGLVTRITYNFRGQVASMAVQSRITTFAYDAVGNLIRITGPDGSFFALTYDAAHRLVGVADALGNTIAYTLDAAGNRVKTDAFDPSHKLARTHSRMFDGFSRLYQDIGAANQVSTIFHDSNDNEVDIRNPINVDRTNSFDALNRLINTSKNGSSISFAYDANGRLNNEIDPRSLVTRYTYDGLDDQTSISSPDTGGTSRAYDAAGNMVQSTDANGNKSTYSYDALNRVTKQGFSDGTAVSLEYDEGPNGIGRLTSITDPSGKTTLRYNRHGELQLKRQTIGAIALTTKWDYSDRTGLLSSLTYPSGAQVSFGYDADGKVSSIAYRKSGGRDDDNGDDDDHKREQQLSDGAANTLLTGIRYQPFGAVASWSNGNGTKYSRSYDLDGRLATVTMPANTGLGLSYDAVSRITAIMETGLPDKQFTYDNLDRLISYTSGSLMKTYGYDAVGNRTTYASSSPAVSLSYQYPTTSNRLLGASGSWNESYTYDANGNVTGHQTPQGNYSFGYSARNRQIEATFGATTKSFLINGFGQRAAKLDRQSYQTLFAYDTAGHLLGSYNGDGTEVHENVWLGDIPVAVLDGSKPYFVAPDHLGAPHQITDRTGNIVWLWDHDPFGNGEPTGTFDFDLRFPGQFFDAQTGLHYNYFRDYDPAKGRYLQSDPIGLRAGANTFAYVRNNPLTHVDPRGQGILQALGQSVLLLGVLAGEFETFVWNSCGERCRPTTPPANTPAVDPNVLNNLPASPPPWQTQSWLPDLPATTYAPPDQCPVNAPVNSNVPTLTTASPSQPMDNSIPLKEPEGVPSGTSGDPSIFNYWRIQPPPRQGRNRNGFYEIPQDPVEFGPWL